MKQRCADWVVPKGLITGAAFDLNASLRWEVGPEFFSKKSGWIRVGNSYSIGHDGCCDWGPPPTRDGRKLHCSLVIERKSRELLGRICPAGGGQEKNPVDDKGSHNQSHANGFMDLCPKRKERTIGRSFGAYEPLACCIKKE